MFFISEKKDPELISAFLFATRIEQSLFFINSKFQASSYRLWLYRTVFVGPGRKSEHWFFGVVAHTLKAFKNAKNEMH